MMLPGGLVSVRRLVAKGMWYQPVGISPWSQPGSRQEGAAGHTVEV
jgi:hypothetical protein